MKILSAEQIRAWDQFTIKHEPIASIDLMERAAGTCMEWLQKNDWLVFQFAVFCGKGNNGGDGLAIARMLAEKGNSVTVYILEFGHKGTDDFQVNLARLHEHPSVEIHYIQNESNFHAIAKDTVIIDALFGSGLSRPLDGVTAQLVNFINESGCTIISIDIPSGLSVDNSSKGNIIIKADYTLSFQCYKLAFLLPENGLYVGEVAILDIGLLPEFLQTVESKFDLIDLSMIRSIYKPRNRFTHKGNFGHALIIAGSYGKIGAAVLSSNACLRSGAGLLTTCIPRCGYDIMQTSVPEAMVLTDVNDFMITKIEIDLSTYNAIGMGPGFGTAKETRKAVIEFFSTYKETMVIDADALNIIAMEKCHSSIPPDSILTPHPKEFERLFGKTNNDIERLEKAIEQAAKLDCIIVLKGHHSFIATPSGHGFFNNTGNAGMATAGSGDVLTGILTGLLVQGYTSKETAILGVFLHGSAGDIAADNISKESMIAGDINTNIGNAFKKLER